MSALKQRHEIDGLRALAVLPVILFHAGVPALGGGFVGVDVFFVISGYLITSLLLKDLQAGRFSLLDFYERRARRILPALFLVLLCCLPFAWLWLLPSDAKSFAQSLTAVTVFASNLLFWQTSSYFDSQADLKPLLHTWSLAVEEQYYLFFPLLLLALRRFRTRSLVAVLLVVTLISLGWAEAQVRTQPEASFYLLHTRAWELLLGALTAIWLMQRGELPPPSPITQSASMIGLALLVLANLAFDRSTPFPSLWAVIPTLGTALIIAFAHPHSLVGRLLSWRPLVAVGLISYSAYLWHQPLFAFARHRSLETPGVPLMLFLSVCSLLLAYMSWRWVEQPWRDRSRFSRRQVFLMALVGSLAFAVIGLVGHFTQVLQKPMEPAQSAFLDHFENSLPRQAYFQREDYASAYRSECDFYNLDAYRRHQPTRQPLAQIADSCHVRDGSRSRAVLIWGDSHAAQLNAGLAAHLPSNWQRLQVSSSGCAPGLDGRLGSSDYCEHSNAFALQTIQRARPDVVIVAQRQQHDAVQMQRIADAVKRLAPSRVMFVGPTPQWTQPLPNLVVDRMWRHTPQRTWVGVDRNVVQLDAALQSTWRTVDPDWRYLSVIDALCNPQGCPVFFGDDRMRGISSFDYGHLTPLASRELAQRLLAPAVIGAVPVESAGSGS